MAAVWRGDVPTLTLLNQLVLEELPLGLRAGPVAPFFQRDVYFDSADRALHRRGVTCRFRVRLDDTRVLTVRVVGVTTGAATAETFEALVPEIDGESALTGTSEPARRLRALIEPQQLRPRVQFETERRVRRTLPRLLARGRYDLAYDVVTVRRGPLTQTFQELKIVQIRRGRPNLAALGQAFVERYNLRPLLAGKLDRAEKALRDIEGSALARRAPDAPEGHEVALIVLQDGEVALFNDATGLTLPVTAGRGEETCRGILRAQFGSADGQLRFLGTAPGSESRPTLEVWLARRAPSADVAGSGRVRWVRFAEVLASVGGPGLRDPRTLAALTIVSRAEAVLDPMRLPRTGGRRLRVADVSEAARPAEGFLNADLSQLEFNARVLALAEDSRVPLLARLRFLSICSSNLDEFFMVRVGTLKQAVGAGVTDRGEDGLTSAEQFDAVKLRIRLLLERQARCFAESCIPALAALDIRLLRWADLTEPQREHLRRYFEDQIFPILTPQAITRAPGHPFPLVAHLRLSLAVMVNNPLTGALQFAYSKVPEGIPRFLPLPDSRHFVPVEDVIRANLGALYPGMTVQGAYAFRLTRAADLELDEHHAVSLLQAMQEEASRRPYGVAVRLEVERAMPPMIRDLVLRELQFEHAAPGTLLNSGDVYDDDIVDVGGVRELARLPLEGLDYPPHEGATPIPKDRSIFSVIADRDVLVHHPYDSFEATVGRLFDEAADDPDVLAIKLTLYRAGGRSGIVDALLRAAERGKEVFVFVELKARFDEERNIEWARTLERQGIRVVYGLVDLKTHAKTTLVVRREPEGIKRYVHIGTGNYNAATAALYTDLGLFSADPTLGADINDLFNGLSGSSQPPQTPFRAILVAPVFLLPRLLELIAREAEHARAGRGGSIRAKLNGLADPDVVTALYRASQAGVNIELIVRGICTLRPGVPGLSESIRVVSVLGRFLEHSRILRFGNGGDPDYYIGSADWRPRNLRRRVEVLTPVRDASCRSQLDAILQTQLADADAWELLSDGTYERREAASPR
jgi:polyphosphate kinase